MRLLRSRRRWRYRMSRCPRRFADRVNRTNSANQLGGDLRQGTRNFFGDYKLEVIGTPFSDVDTAKSFYSDIVGFTVDHDMFPRPGVRVVQ